MSTPHPEDQVQPKGHVASQQPDTVERCLQITDICHQYGFVLHLTTQHRIIMPETLSSGHAVTS